MIKENEFIRNIKREKQLPPEREWEFRRYFRSLSDDQKSERGYIKQKNSMSFDEWWELISENIEEGYKIHQQNQDNFKLGHEHDKLRHQLNDPEYREYIGLDPLTDEELKEVKEQFKSNTDGRYEYPDLGYLDESDEEEEISDKTEEMIDESMKNFKEGNVSDPVDFDELKDALNEEE